MFAGVRACSFYSGPQTDRSDTETGRKGDRSFAMLSALSPKSPYRA
jgi:hypothetical protein